MLGSHIPGSESDGRGSPREFQRWMGCIGLKWKASEKVLRLDYHENYIPTPETRFSISSVRVDGHIHSEVAVAIVIFGRIGVVVVRLNSVGATWWLYSGSHLPSSDSIGHHRFGSIPTMQDEDIKQEDINTIEDDDGIRKMEETMQLDISTIAQEPLTLQSDHLEPPSPTSRSSQSPSAVKEEAINSSSTPPYSACAKLQTQIHSQWSHDVDLLLKVQSQWHNTRIVWCVCLSAPSVRPTMNLSYSWLEFFFLFPHFSRRG